MEKQKIKYTVIDPNPPDVTLNALKRIIIEKVLQAERKRNTMSKITT